MIKIFEVCEKISPVIMINEHYNNHTEEEFNNWYKNQTLFKNSLIAQN